ncbi:SNF2 family N-terminal domain-containing protein [Auriculariales sp. MPI-PUGE-AT-0066]|nr:SNF2 family N-terminal domain-containing protein [Auriculariales sp. MPI-PUGE-AT-0066]
MGSTNKQLSLEPALAPMEPDFPGDHKPGVGYTNDNDGVWYFLKPPLLSFTASTLNKPSASFPHVVGGANKQPSLLPALAPKEPDFWGDLVERTYNTDGVWYLLKPPGLSSNDSTWNQPSTSFPHTSDGWYLKPPSSSSSASSSSGLLSSSPTASISSRPSASLPYVVGGSNNHPSLKPALAADSWHFLKPPSSSSAASTSSKPSASFPHGMGRSSKQPSLEPALGGDDGADDFDLRADDVIETYVSPEEAQKQVLQLLQSDDDHTEEFNPDDKFVEGFAKEFTLLPHQIIGRNFMRSREAADKKKYGGILADDMGFGKTITTAAHISDNRPNAKDRSKWSRATLIVVPASLVSQWAAELKEKVPDLKVLEHAGLSRPHDTAEFAPYDAVITSYQTLVAEYSNSKEIGTNDGAKKTSKSKTTAKPKHSALMQQRWYRVVLDEAHNIKNRNAHMSKAAAELSSKYRWALTGTPIQNNIEELFPMFRFLRINPLEHIDTFKTMISTPISKGGAAGAMKLLQTILKAIMLRRTKASTLNGKPILELPARNVKVVECEFDASERQFYRSLEEQTAKIFNDLDSAEGVQDKYASVLVMLLRLRQTCDHPSLVSKDYRADLEEQLKEKENDDEDDRDANALADMFNDLKVDATKCTVCQLPIPISQKTQTCADCAKILMESRRVTLTGVDNDQSTSPLSAKLRKVHELLRQISDESDRQDKTIIFSQFTGMLDLVGNSLNEKNIKFTRFDGRMSKAQKDASIKLIKESPDVHIILISLSTGGIGLNLTCCNRVILLDPWWNPAIEEQAFDRAHRLGQKKPVEIYKLTIPNTVEKRIIELQEKKRELAMDVLSGNKISATKLTRNELRKLFSGQHDHEDEED